MKIKHCLLFMSCSLGLFAFAGAQAGTTLLVKTDTSCNWKLDGQPMAMLKADESTVVLVSPGKHLIEAAASVGTATLRTEVEVEKIEKTVAIQLKGRQDQQSKLLAPDTPRKLTAEEAAHNPTWTDIATGLMWTAKDNGSDVDWRQATAFCSRLQYAGYTGWRLPTNEELQAIYDQSIKVRKTFSTGRTYDVHVKGNLDITGHHWSSSRGYNLGQPSETSWEFTFAEPIHDTGLPNPFPNFTHFSFNMRALCVRQPRNDVMAH